MGGPSTLRTVVIDDEELARRVLCEYLAAHHDVEIVGECANGFEAVKATTELDPDLLFLDIQMPKLDGFEVLELLGRDVGVIFVTAYDRYALRAFDVHAVDYLLKPFSAERLGEALERARERLRRAETLPVAALAADARPRTGPIDRVLIRDGVQVHVVPVEKIDFIEAQDDYICLHAEGKRYLKDQAMTDIEDALDPQQFVRVHRSYMVNVERIARIELYAKDSRIAILRDGAKLPISRAGYARLGKLLGPGT